MTLQKRNPVALAGAHGADTEALDRAIDNQNPTATDLSPQAKWRSRNPLAVWAQSATRSAIRRGILERKPCAICGDPETDFHHDPRAYDQPLRGTFLCRRHHKAEHKRLKGGAK